MKAMSKFFLIVAGAITLIGCIFLIIGASSAKANGVQLFPQKIDGKYIYSVDLADTEVSKISIDATDTDIYVYTHQDKEYIEFVNFNENYYSISTTNRVVSFDEYVDLKSLLAFWDSNFKFKGVRSLFSLGTKVSGKKEVNIYLSDERDIKIFDFTIENGVIKISDIDTETDYKLTLDNGVVELKNISSLSGVNLKANSCTMNIKECSFSSFTGDVAKINLTGDISGINTFALNAKDGTVNIDADFANEDVSVSVMTNGSLVLNSDLQTTPYKTDASFPDDAKFSTVNVTGETLNFSMNYPEPKEE